MTMTKLLKTVLGAGIVLGTLGAFSITPVGGLETKAGQDDIQQAQNVYCEEVKVKYEENHEELSQKVHDYKDYLFQNEGHKDLETLQEEGAEEVFNDVVKTCRLISLM